MTNEQKEHFLLKIADFEGFRSTAYYCPAKCLSIGFGHRIADSERKRLSLARLTYFQAFELLKADFDNAVKYFVHADFILQEHELYALADIVFNCGWKNFSNGSLPNLCRSYSIALGSNSHALADNLSEQITNKMLQYCHYRRNGKVYVSEGLKLRRQFDVAIFKGTHPILK